MEVIIAAFIMILLLVALLTLLIYGKKAYQHGNERISNAQDLDTVMWHMLVDLRDTDASYITTSTTAFSLLSAYTLNSMTDFVTSSAGVPTNQKAIIYYLSGTTLSRTELTESAGTTTALTTAALSAASSGGKALSTNVTAMTVTPTTSTGSVTVALTCSATDANGNTDSQSETVSIQCRN